MKKNFIFLCIVAVFFISNSNLVKAQERSNFDIQILSPTHINEYPGKDFIIKVKITNKTDKDIKDIFTYITMANLSKKWTVNLEDYSADAGTIIGTIKAHESKIVDLPVTVVYTADYYLYTTVISNQDKQITSSDAIPVTVLGNTCIVPLHVAIVATVIPFLLLCLFICNIRKKRQSNSG